jgi:nicotinate-nucleotide adenylyltransferase
MLSSACYPIYRGFAGMTERVISPIVDRKSSIPLIQNRQSKIENRTSSEEILASARTIGIFGGTFDPVHSAHLLLAECAREELGLDALMFMPANIPPHKIDGRRITPAHCRLEMLRIAIADNPCFSFSTREIDCQGVSYTVDTLQWLHAEHPQAELTLLIGGDAARDFSTWREPEEIARLASLAVWERPGIPLPAEVLPGVGYRVLHSPLVEISSTCIRERVAEGRSIRYRTPESVIDYIYRHGLYR